MDQEQEHICGNQAAAGKSYPKFPDNCHQRKSFATNQYSLQVTAN
jgi:hypothetical protein